MIKLSFIVPVYNVEQYLRKCVDSLLEQDLSSSEYEIILVDDGSTDGCPAICDEYAAKHENIRVIHQKNGGLSAARNAGIKIAKGEYVCFVDSDDYWEENMLGSLIVQVERENLDVLRFDYQNVNERYEVFEPNKIPRYIDLKTDVVDGETYLNERMSYACYAVMFIIKRELLKNCLFKEGIYFEDTEWLPRMLIRAKRVNATRTMVYYYLTREGSITQKFDYEHIRKKNDSLMQVNLSLQHLLPMVKDDRWINGSIADNVNNILNNVALYDYAYVSNWVVKIRDNNMIPLHGYKIRRKTKWRHQLINLSPKLYCWLRHIRTTYL